MTNKKSIVGLIIFLLNILNLLTAESLQISGGVDGRYKNINGKENNFELSR